MRRQMLTTTTALLALLASAACGDDDSAATSDPAGIGSPTETGTPESSPDPSTPSPTSTAPGPGPTATAPPEQDGAEPDDPDERPFPADRSPDTSPGEGFGLSVVDVRVGRHEGYDRVVFELGGEGTVGWTVEYDDAPARQGSGHAVELAGDATLSILLEGVGYPHDTGVEEYDGPRRQAPGLPSVRELELGGVFEGYYDAFVGVAEQRPFRVFRLDDPQRVVLDVQHRG